MSEHEKVTWMQKLSTSWPMSRRHFLLSVSSACLTVGFLPACAEEAADSKIPPLSKRDDSPAARFINNAQYKHERAFVKDLATVLIPRDKDPGAESVDVIAAFAGSIRHDAAHLEILQAGLVSLNALCRKLYPAKQNFIGLAVEQKGFMLQAFFDREDDAQLWRQHDKNGLLYNLFLMLFDCVRSTFYTSKISYKMLNYSAPINGYARYDRAPRGR